VPSVDVFGLKTIAVTGRTEQFGILAEFRYKNIFENIFPYFMLLD
jgi:hypothetical protein